MSAGTIALTNNSTAVTGTGTSFTTDLKVGDFITATVGGIAQTLGVASIASNTSLTLAQAFVGPTTSGLAWVAVPNSTLVGITSQIAAQVWQAIRAYNQEKVNWQNFYTGTGTIKITLFDGTEVSGLAWPSINDAVNTKAAKGVNSDITSLTGLTTALSIAQGGTGAKTKADAWTALATYGTTAGTAAQGNDSRLNTIDQKSGGTVIGSIGSRANVSSEVNSIGGVISSDIRTNGTSRGNLNLYMTINSNAVRQAKLDVYSDGANGRSFTFYQDSGSAACSGSWINGSDERHKSNIKLVPDALRAVLSWRGCTYDKLDGMAEVGLIAQDVEKDCPVAVMNSGSREFSNGLVIEDFKNLNVAGASAAYHTEAIKALFSLVELAIADPDKALASIDAIKAQLKSE